MASLQRVSTSRPVLGGGDLFVTEGVQAVLGNPATGDVVGGEERLQEKSNPDLKTEFRP